jgi:hypothetical protein
MKAKNQINNASLSSKLWLVFGALIAAGAAAMIFRELPAMRREFKLLRM